MARIPVSSAGPFFNRGRTPLGDLPASVVLDSLALANSVISAAVGNRRRGLRDFPTLKDYDGIGDGVHTAADTAAFTNAVADMPSGGTLWVPQGFWTLNAAITLSKPITIISVGFGVSGVNRGSQVVQTVDNTDAFIIASDYVSLIGFTVTTNVGSPTGGNAIHQTSGAFTIIERMAASGFFNTVNFEQSQGASICRNVFIGPKNYNVYVRNTVSADTGDSQLIGNYIGGNGVTALAGLRYESSGGLRTIGNKIIQHQRGIDLQVPDGAITGVLPIVGNSIENQSVNCIRAARSGTTGQWSQIGITGNQINGTQISGANDVIQVGAGISEVAIVGNPMISGTANTTAVHAASGADGVLIDSNILRSHSVGIQNDGSNVSRHNNQYRSVTTRYAGAGTIASTDNIDSAVTAPTPAGTWSNFGAPYAGAGYYLSAGRVYLRGVMKSTGADNTLFTLPAGFRPAASLFKRCSSSSGGSEDVTVANTGVVSVGSGVAHTYLTLDGIDFLQEA